MRPGSLPQYLVLFLPTIAAFLLVLLLTAPFVHLAASASWSHIMDAMESEEFLQALLLSLRSSLLALGVIVVGALPLAWWLSRKPTGLRGWVGTLLEIPIVIPPAVVGVALILFFGRQGAWGHWLESLGWGISFSETAVVISQIVVAAPFFITAATASFSRLDPDLWIVARSLGASPLRAFFSVVLPSCLPGLVAGASLAWARGLGEFGATLLFAGNLPGVTQTLPLGIYAALEKDLGLAVSYALLLGCLGVALLIALRFLVGARLVWRPEASTRVPHRVGPRQ